MKTEIVKIKEFKVLQDFEADFKGANVLLVGDNGVGKSSVMQFIQIALGNTSNIPPNATGEGEVVMDKEGNKYTFFVKFKDGKPQVSVVGPDGLKDTRKSTIASLVGAIDFNIDEFVSLSDTTAGRKKQVDIYKSLLDKEIIEGINKLEVTNQGLYDERTEINRKIKTLDGFIRESPLFGKELEVELIDVTSINAEIQKMHAANEQISSVESRIKERERKLNEHSQRLTDLMNQVRIIEKEMEEAKQLNADAQKWLSENPKQDTAVLYNQVSAAAEQNKTVELAKEQKSKTIQLEKFQNEVGELTAQIESNRQAIADAIRDMNVPVEGLMFDSDQLIYNGIPVSDSSLSTSEKLHLGAKLKIAQNSDFGVLFMEHGESIGAARMKEILDMAAKHNWQVIMEQVERGTEELRIEFIHE